MTELRKVPEARTGLMTVPLEVPFAFCTCGNGTAMDPYHLADHEWRSQAKTKHLYCCEHFSHIYNARLLPGRSCRFGSGQIDRRRGPDRRDIVNRRAFMDRRNA